MSAGVWKDSYQAAVDGNLSLVEHHIREKVNSNYQHPEILRTPMVASCKLQAARKHGHEEFVALFLRLGVKDPSRPFWWRWLPV